MRGRRLYELKNSKYGNEDVEHLPVTGAAVEPVAYSNESPEVSAEGAAVTPDTLPPEEGGAGTNNVPVPLPDADVDGLSVTPPAASSEAGGVNAARPTLPFHRYANLFPMLSEQRLDALTADIGLNGLIDDITTLNGEILDGRGREVACALAGVTPHYKEYDGNDAFGFVLSRNLRRDMTDSQRALLAARVATLEVGANQHSKEGLPIGRAAAQFGTSASSIARAKNVLAGGIPDVIAAVEAGRLTISAANHISNMSAGNQAKALREHLKGGKRKLRTNGAAQQSGEGLPTVPDSNMLPPSESTPTATVCLGDAGEQIPLAPNQTPLPPTGPSEGDSVETDPQVVPTASVSAPHRQPVAGEEVITDGIPSGLVRLNAKDQDHLETLVLGFNASSMPVKKQFLGEALKGVANVETIIAQFEAIHSKASGNTKPTDRG